MQTITRSDGIIYERRTKEKQYDANIHIRISKNDLDELKKIAEKENVKYNALIRELIEDFIERQG